MTPRGRTRPGGRLARWVLVPVGLVVALGLGTGHSYAYFSAQGGSGAATGATSTVLPLVIRSATTGSLASSLLPGGTADLIVSARNPNAVPVTIIKVAQGGGVTVSGGTAGCTSDPDWPGILGSSGVSVATTDGLSVAVGAGATVTFHLASAAVMALTSASGCQGATFRIPVTVTVQR